jgi:hypothetical protein
MAYGQSGHLAICFQQSFGTSLTSSPFFIPLISETVGETIRPLPESGLYGRLAESPYHEGIHEVGGQVRTEAHPIYLGAFLKAALGPAASTAQDSAFLHEFLPAAADWDAFAALPPLTMAIHRDVGSAFLYSDLLGSGVSLEIAHGQLLSATLEVVGGRFSRQAPASPSFHPGRPWSWDVVSAEYDGVGMADFRQLSVRFDNQLAAQHTLSGEKAPRRVKRGGPQKVAVEGSFLLSDQALFDAFLAQAEKRLLLSCAGEAVSSGYTALLTLDVPRLRFTELSPQLRGPGAVEVAFKAAGMYDAGSDYALRITLTNTQPGY